MFFLGVNVRIYFSCVDYAVNLQLFVESIPKLPKELHCLRETLNLELMCLRENVGTLEHKLDILVIYIYYILYIQTCTTYLHMDSISGNFGATYLSQSGNIFIRMSL